MPDFIGDKEETTHSCATCKYGMPMIDRYLCSQPDRVASSKRLLAVPFSPVRLRLLMQPTDVCELWEGKD